METTKTCMVLIKVEKHYILQKRNSVGGHVNIILILNFLTDLHV